MRITAFTVKDFKRLEEIHIEPGERQLVWIEGNNDQGKSCVIDAALVALAGPSGKELIRHGADSAELAMTLSDGVETFKIHRVLSVDKVDPETGETKRVPPSFEIRSVDGREMKSPKAILDKLIGGRFIDAMAFYEQRGADRQRTLLRALGLGDELDRLQQLRKDTFAERTVVNRHLKAAEGAVATLPAPPDEAALVPIDISAMQARRAALQQVDQERERQQAFAHALRGESDQVTREIDRAREEIVRLERRIEELAERRKHIDDQLSTAIKTIGAYSPYTDWTLDEEIARGEEHNRQVAQARALVETRARALAEAQQHRAESERLTAALADIDARKAAALATADLPVDGLSMDDDGNIRMRGVLLDSLGDSAKLRLALAIAAAMRPDLEDIFIDRAERLDANGRATLLAFATEHKLRVWAARVGIGFDDAIVIEEGRVKGAANGGTL